MREKIARHTFIGSLTETLYTTLVLRIPIAVIGWTLISLLMIKLRALD